MTVSLVENVALGLNNAYAKRLAFDTVGKGGYNLLATSDPDAAIKALFANNEQGAWYDPSDFDTMFQDSTGTTPVTAVGQSVGLILDKSGRGNHASQATSAARPALQQDAGGKYYLNFDGVDDFLGSGTTDEWVPPFEYLAAFQIGTRGGTGEMLFFRGNDPGVAPTSSNTSGIGQRSDVVERVTASSRIGSGTSNYVQLNFAYVVGGSPEVARVFSHTGPDVLQVECNGVSDSATPTNTGTPAFQAFYIGTSLATSTSRIYNAIAINRALTTQEVTDVIAWLNEKAGV